MTSIHKHMSSMFHVPEPQNTSVKVNRCQDVQITQQMRVNRNVDLILFVTANATQNDGFAAWATPCQLNQSTGRPDVGQVNLNPYVLNTNTKFFFDQFSTVIHEIYHVMGFNNDLFKYFINPSTGRRVPVSDTYRYQPSQPRPYLIVAPIVKNYAAKYYGCNSVVGVPLEDGGGSGSAGSHWEKTALGNEMMVADTIANPKISGFTMLLF